LKSIPLSRHFSGTYVEARHKFLEAATRRGASLQTYLLPGYQGEFGESLSIDVAYLGKRGASKLMIVSSGTHGPEGFCGSGCQVAALSDAALSERIERSGIGMLMIHALNPYGFSHMQRTNQDNVDLNRNHVDFESRLPDNPDYQELDRLLLPERWPPTCADDRALDAYVEKHGADGYRKALMSGQHSVPDGIYFGGSFPTWNNDMLRAVLRQHASNATHIGWIDVHSGLGPWGHGEKIYAGRDDAEELALTRLWWGGDVFSPYEGQSKAPEASGTVLSTVYVECPAATAAVVGLEFGTLPEPEMIYRLRASHWLLRHPDASTELRSEIKEALRAAFYCDDNVWRGMVWGQTRVAMLQALVGLSRI
jgi:hypothetical protein